MDRPRHQLLAGSALADHEHGAAGRGGRFDALIELPHLWTGADETVKAAARRRAECCRIALELVDARRRRGLSAAKVGVGENDHATVAQFVEYLVHAAGRLGGREDPRGGLLEQVHRGDHLGERHTTRGETLSDLVNLGGEARKVSCSERAGRVEIRTGDAQKLGFGERPSFAEVKLVEPQPLLENLASASAHLGQNGAKLEELVFEEEVEIERRLSGRGRLRNDRAFHGGGVAAMQIGHRSIGSAIQGHRPRNVSTGHGAARTTFSATLPRNTRFTPLRPCVAMTIRSAFILRAAARISVAGAPSPVTTRHLRCRFETRL